MWIPFDYGIGPNEMLQADPKVKKRVFQTTASAYKYYLDGILEAPKGNPKKKNFTGTDFN